MSYVGHIKKTTHNLFSARGGTKWKQRIDLHVADVVCYSAYSFGAPPHLIPFGQERYSHVNFAANLWTWTFSPIGNEKNWNFSDLSPIQPNSDQYNLTWLYSTSPKRESHYVILFQWNQRGDFKDSFWAKLQEKLQANITGERINNPKKIQKMGNNIFLILYFAICFRFLTLNSLVMSTPTCDTG
jgi:hypothetical protein